MVDEAHRTQEGDFGRRMRTALPNAFLFGLTGTPINKADKNTFWAFGAAQDTGGYMSRYTFQESIRDNLHCRCILSPVYQIIISIKRAWILPSRKWPMI